MTNKIRSLIKIGFGLFIPFILIFAGCGPSNQEIMARNRLANAKAAYADAKADPNVEINAQGPLMDAGSAVEAASQAKEFDEMDHLAYLAQMKTKIAVATAEAQMAENEQKVLSQKTEDLIVQGREQEQRAKMEAIESNAQARASNAQARQSNADARQSNAEAWSQTQKAQIAEMEARDSDAQARQSNAEAWSQTQKAEKATAKADKLEQEIADMKGRMTERGIVLTIGDVLFATGTATLSPMADNEINKLADFMKAYPERNVLIEGHTDSIGKEGTNLDLSLDRAKAVKNKLVDREISRGRITTKGLGEEYPVASNDTAGGREQNRRVEVIILNEGVNPLSSR
jgi:outer membrane protein OmpA-like peptidoglycan-associated protein